MPEEREEAFRTMMRLLDNDLYQKLRPTYQLWLVTHVGSFRDFVFGLLEKALEEGLIPD